MATQSLPIVEVEITATKTNNSNSRRLINWNAVNQCDLFESPNSPGEYHKAEITFQNGATTTLEGTRTVQTFLQDLHTKTGYSVGVTSKAMGGRQ